jgi:C1A family cysteine protease
MNLKSLVAGLILLTAGSLYMMQPTTPALTEEMYASHFLGYVAEFNKDYSDAVEMAHRFSIFKQNLDIVNAHNAKESSFKMGINQFSDLTDEEFKATHTGFRKKNASLRGEYKCEVDVPSKDIKSSIDWRELNKVTPVKDQGSCGSCWAFSATGTLEAHWLVEDDPHRTSKPDFAEQELVDCVYPEDQDTCQTGGEMVDAFKYLAFKELIW